MLTLGVLSTKSCPVSDSPTGLGPTKESSEYVLQISSWEALSWGAKGKAWLGIGDIGAPWPLHSASHLRILGVALLFISFLFLALLQALLGVYTHIVCFEKEECFTCYHIFCKVQWGCLHPHFMLWELQEEGDSWLFFSVERSCWWSCWWWRRILFGFIQVWHQMIEKKWKKEKKRKRNKSQSNSTGSYSAVLSLIRTP